MRAQLEKAFTFSCRCLRALPFAEVSIFQGRLEVNSGRVKRLERYWKAIFCPIMHLTSHCVKVRQVLVYIRLVPSAKSVVRHIIRSGLSRTLIRC